MCVNACACVSVRESTQMRACCTILVAMLLVEIDGGC